MTDAPLPVRKRELPETPAQITTLVGVLSPDQKRVKVSVELDIDSTRPDLEMILLDANKDEISRSTIIENFGSRIDFTLHIRHADVPLPLTLTCKVSYEDDKVVSEKTVFVEQLA